MRTETTDKSLVQILIDRHDTGFDGYPVDESTAIRSRDSGAQKVFQDENGQWYIHPHDLIVTKEVDGDPVGILVGDVDGRNCMDHPYSHLPHPIGLYVREDYRSQGIASELIHDYMDYVESDRCVIDCEIQLVSFYEQFDYEIIYLQNFHRGMDPTTVPRPPESNVLDIDTSNSPKHDIPFNRADQVDSSSAKRLSSGVEVVIRQDRNVGQQCSIEIQMPCEDFESGDYTPYRLTDDAISKINNVAKEYTSQSVGRGDFTSIGWLMPDDARSIADRIYPILDDESNMELLDR